MVGFTWPTKDDESSSETEQKPTSQAQQNRNRLNTNDDQSSELVEEKVTSVPLRLVLFPTEDELSLSQMTPSSSVKAFNLNQNPSNRRRSDGDENSSTSLHQSDEMWQQHCPDTKRLNEHPQLLANPDSKVSFYVSQSLQSPANSPQFEEKHLPGESSPDKNIDWQSFGEDSRLALCTEDMGSGLERLEVQCDRYC